MSDCLESLKRLTTRLRVPAQVVLIVSCLAGVWYAICMGVLVLLGY